MYGGCAAQPLFLTKSEKRTVIVTAKTTLFAAIDVGSHEVALKIVEKTPKGLKTLDSVSHVIDLGTETYLNGKISFPLVEECCRTLNGFVRIMKEYKITCYTAMATSALREAQNVDYIVAQIELNTGLKVSVINNATERYLQTLAVVANTPGFTEMTQAGLILLDIGAGSVQITHFDNGCLVNSQNIKLGSLRVRELLSTVEKQTLSFTQILEEYIRVNVKVDSLQYSLEKKPVHFIGIGSVVRFIKKIAAANDYFSKESFSNLFSYLADTSAEEIAVKYGIPWESAELLLPCAVIIRQFLSLTDAAQIYAPSVELCDGIIAGYIVNHYNKTYAYNLEKDILESAKALAKRFHYNETSAALAERFCDKLFKALKSRHGFGSREQLLLKICAHLQDIGEYISAVKQYEISRDMIKNSEIFGLTQTERDTCALIVQYSAHDVPKPGELSSKKLIKVARLCAILKLADALNYGKSGKIQDIKIKISNEKFLITVMTNSEITLEKWEFNNRKGFFEEVYGLLPELKVESIQKK